MGMQWPEPAAEIVFPLSLSDPTLLQSPQPKNLTLQYYLRWSPLLTWQRTPLRPRHLRQAPLFSQAGRVELRELRSLDSSRFRAEVAVELRPLLLQAAEGAARLPQAVAEVRLLLVVEGVLLHLPDRLSVSRNREPESWFSSV
jgi:hypothetical protein